MSDDHERAPLPGTRPVVVAVPSADASGAPVLVRAVLVYARPGLVLHGAPVDVVAGTARRLRAALEGAGYVWPVRAVDVGAWPAPADGPGLVLERTRAPGDPGPVLEWWAGWETAAASRSSSTGPVTRRTATRP